MGKWDGGVNDDVMGPRNPAEAFLRHFSRIHNLARLRRRDRCFSSRHMTAHPLFSIPFDTALKVCVSTTASVDYLVTDSLIFESSSATRNGFGRTESIPAAAATAICSALALAVIPMIVLRFPAC